MNKQEENSTESRLQELQKKITALDEEGSLAELKAMLDEGIDPKLLLACCMEGMRRVGILFEEGKYFIAGLIMGGEIMRSATELLTPFLSSQQTSGDGGRIMLGTIQGDIHDLGKSLFSLLLKCNGFEVIDLGVDIPPATFLEKALEFQPDIIGISCVLTNNVDNLKIAVNLLMSELSETGTPIVIGGTCLDDQMARHVGTKYWTVDAADGLQICQRIISEKQPK